MPARAGAACAQTSCAYQFFPRQIAVVSWHIIEGEDGCVFARTHGCVAVIVDALRASATAAMLLDAGATELLVVRELSEAFAVRERRTDALLFGERNGLPPEGFDGGNSPRDVGRARGRPVIFTTTTGANRLISAWGARAVLLGSPVNASAVIEAARQPGADVVLVPAGLTGNPSFNAQEDWAAAALIASRAEAEVCRGADTYRYWLKRIKSEGLLRLFETAPHADNLRAVGLGEDIPFCAEIDVTCSVPGAVEKAGACIRCVDVSRQ